MQQNLHVVEVYTVDGTASFDRCADKYGCGLILHFWLGSDVELRRPLRGVVVELLKMRSGELNWPRAYSTSPYSTRRMFGLAHRAATGDGEDVALIKLFALAFSRRPDSAAKP
tara:strand:- start:1559 stop:1897 length:339 start_codon:yes stop_codon:yes gene_type:complete